MRIVVNQRRFRMPDVPAVVGGWHSRKPRNSGIMMPSSGPPKPPEFRSAIRRNDGPPDDSVIA